MATKIGRNDPCPCGSGKKYKQCCITKSNATSTGMSALKKKFTAKLLTQPKPVDLMERTFGPAIETISKEEEKHSQSETEPQSPAENPPLQ
jgi:hypothetical protein